MKLHFEPNLDYQHDAIEAVCDLFRGQEICRTEFTVTKAIDVAVPEFAPGFAQNELGIGNRLTLLDDEILANLRDVQLHNGLRPSSLLASGDFTVEMETGTGKNLCLSAHDIRAEPAFWLHQVRHRRPLRGNQRRGL